MTIRSHGCGRRMARNGPDAALAEAIERRRRLLTAGGNLYASDHGREHDRRWASAACDRVRWSVRLQRMMACDRPCPEPEDVTLVDGVPVATCWLCQEGRDDDGA